MIDEKTYCMALLNGKTTGTVMQQVEAKQSPEEQSSKQKASTSLHDSMRQKLSECVADPKIVDRVMAALAPVLAAASAGEVKAISIGEIDRLVRPFELFESQRLDVVDLDPLPDGVGNVVDTWDTWRKKRKTASLVLVGRSESKSRVTTDDIKEQPASECIRETKEAIARTFPAEFRRKLEESDAMRLYDVVPEDGLNNCLFDDDDEESRRKMCALQDFEAGRSTDEIMYDDDYDEWCYEDDGWDDGCGDDDEEIHALMSEMYSKPVSERPGVIYPGEIFTLRNRENGQLRIVEGPTTYDYVLWEVTHVVMGCA